MEREAIWKWADQLKELWNEHGPAFAVDLPYEVVESFVDQLETLLMISGDMREASDETEDMYVLAADVFAKWTELMAVRSSMGSVPIGGHKLPPLPYNYDALEPYISEEIMRLHHDKHHQSYVNGLNKAEKEMQKARDSNHFDLIKHWEREAAFNGAGHYLHTIFWDVMSPKGGGEPTGELAKQITADFGSFKKMKAHFSAAAEAVEGGGWALLVWSPRSHRLQILQAEKHQNLSQQDVIPLLPLDVWEHAYYLQYKNERKPYIDNWWNIVNWPEVEERFEQASQVKWKPY